MYKDGTYLDVGTWKVSQSKVPHSGIVGLFNKQCAKLK